MKTLLAPVKSSMVFNGLLFTAFQNQLPLGPQFASIDRLRLLPCLAEAYVIILCDLYKILNKLSLPHLFSFRIHKNLKTGSTKFLRVKSVMDLRFTSEDAEGKEKISDYPNRVFELLNKQQRNYYANFQPEIKHAFPAEKFDSKQIM